MARLKIISDTPSRTDQPNPNVVTRQFHSDSEGNRITEGNRTRSNIYNMIVSSDTYKQAYQLFSSINDSSWLQKLTLIPDSFDDPQKNILDTIDLGLSTQYQDKLKQSYEDAMLAIRKLVSDYYEHVNTLPKTQVQQFADAGVNTAITGNGLDSSELSSDIPSPSPVTVSPSPISSLLEVGNFLVSATSGFADLAIKFRDLGLRSNRQSFDISKEKVSIVSDLNKYIRENGIVGDPITWDSLVSGDAASFKYRDANGSDIALSSILNLGLKKQKYDSLFSHLSSEYPDLVGSYFPVQMDNVNHSGQQGVYFDSVGIDATSEALYKLYKLDKDHEVYMNSYTRKSASASADLTEAEKNRIEYEDAVKQYEANRAIILDDLISELYESNNPADRALLTKILLNYNRKDINRQTIDNIGATVGIATDVADTVVGATKPASVVNHYH